MTRLVKSARSLFASPSTNPLGTLWVIAMFAVFGIGRHWWTGATAMIILSVGLVTLVTIAFWLAIQQVHSLVNSKSDLQIERIQQLISTMQANNVEVPDPKDKD